MYSALPKMVRIRQLFPKTLPLDLRRIISIEFAKISDKLAPGGTVALAVGSRGIANLQTILGALIELIQGAGARPFIIPAMGSHGGATPQGQAELLAGYGITEANVGAPVRPSLDVRQVGVTRSGVAVHCSVEALAADAILLVNRIKPHTDFQGNIGSGLLKIAVVGLGKREGAATMHAAASQFGHERMIREISQELLRVTPIIGGLAIIEDQHHQTSLLEMISSDQLPAGEEQLLERARELLPVLPFEEIDLLIVDRIGKNISGSGMDPNVTGRWVQGYSSALAREARAGPFIRRIFVRDLTPETHGNAIGIGLADLTTARLVRGINHGVTYINALTSLTPQTAKIPVYFETDREVLEHAVTSLALPDRKQARIVRIGDTLSLEELEISEALFDAAETNTRLEKVGAPAPICFDDLGNMFPL